MNQLQAETKDRHEKWSTLPYAQKAAKQMSSKGNVAYIFKNDYDNYIVRNYRKTPYYWEKFISEHRNGKIYHPKTA